jgi:DNA-binding transcriptional ArsR family regulator
MNGAEDSVFSALSDGTRRRILEWLDGGARVTATELAQRLPISRQAVTKHLKELEGAHLVTSEKEGREVLFAATSDGLGAAAQWLANRSAEWDARLERLRDSATDKEGRNK